MPLIYLTPVKRTRQSLSVAILCLSGLMLNGTAALTQNPPQVSAQPQVQPPIQSPIQSPGRAQAPVSVQPQGHATSLVSPAQSPVAGATPVGQSPAKSVLPASAQTAPSPPASTSAPVRSRDSQVAMDALQAFNPSGWTSSATKIFMPGIEAQTENPARTTPSPLAAPEEDSQIKAVSNAPQFVPFEQLTSEVEAQRVAILKEFRCNSVYSKNYKRGQRTISARIYQFSNPESAYGAYSLLRQGASTVVKRGDASSEDDQGISFWQGRTFVSIYGTSIDDDESKEVVRSLADKFSSSLKEHASLPGILDQLPRLDIVKGSEHIVMGTLSARRFSPAPYLNYLDFSHAAAAATADYQIQTPPDRLKLLYVDFQYPGYANAAYRAYTQNFGGRSVPTEEPLMGETCMFKVNGTFILCQQLGGRLAIISGARKKQSAAVLARFLH